MTKECILLTLAVLVMEATEKKKWCDEAQHQYLEGSPMNISMSKENINLDNLINYTNSCGQKDKESLNLTKPLDEISSSKIMKKSHIEPIQEAEFDKFVEEKLKERKRYDVKVDGALGSTKCFQLDGKFYIKKVLKDKMNKSKLKHEKEIHRKLNEVDGVVKAYPDLSSPDDIVMEVMSVDGFQILEYLIENKKQASEKFIIDLLHLLKPLGGMHERGITHNDICAENIMYKKEWKFIDFDLAKESRTKFIFSGHKQYWSLQHQQSAPTWKHESLNVFEKFEICKDVVDTQKEDVYALGMIALLFISPGKLGSKINCPTNVAFPELELQPVISFLRMKKYITVDEEKKKVEWVRDKIIPLQNYRRWLMNTIPTDTYSPHLMRLISKMINPDPEERISANDAFQRLQEISKSEI